jgi:Zn-finger nucleic acid-binding protein
MATTGAHGESMQVCPRCGGAELVQGSLISSDEDARITGNFHPEGLKFWLLRRSVELKGGKPFQACSTCGCVWSQLDPVSLRRLLEHRASTPSLLAVGLSWGAKFVLLAGLVLLIIFVIIQSTSHLG